MVPAGGGNGAVRLGAGDGSGIRASVVRTTPCSGCWGATPAGWRDPRGRFFHANAAHRRSKAGARVLAHAQVLSSRRVTARPPRVMRAAMCKMR